MKVAVATGMLPVRGGATLLFDWLCSELRERGHDVTALKIPAPRTYRELPASMLAYRLMKIPEDIDVLVTGRLPAHALCHPHKNVWFWHHHRGAFDLWGTPHQDLPNTPVGVRYRDLILEADNRSLLEAANVFTNSKIVGRRLLQFNQVDSEVVYPPLRHSDRYENLGSGDEIVYIARVNAVKRQHLLIQALSCTVTPVRIRIAGRPEDAQYEQALVRMAAELGVADRVVFDLGWIDESEKVKRIGECLAAAYFPVDEDSYGYPTLEAQHAAKAVITTSDAGGTDELISHGYNGLVAQPTPQSIAMHMDRLWEDRAYAAWLGENATTRLAELDISWDETIGKLLR